jgi:hypothetical protein
VYNYVRYTYGLKPKYSFKDINPNPAIYKMLEVIYNGDINKVHTLVGAQAETPLVPNYDLGELNSVILWEQMDRLRKADRFWYEREFCYKELK